MAMNEQERTQAWREAWINLINESGGATLNGMYCMLTGGENLLGALIGGGPYSADLETSNEDDEPRRLTVADKAQVMTDLAGATHEGMTVNRVLELEEAFKRCLANDQAADSIFEVDDDIGNAICRHVIDELEEGIAEDSDDDADVEVSMDDKLNDLFEEDDTEARLDFAGDLESRLQAAGINVEIDLPMLEGAETVADLCRSVAEKARSQAS